MDALYQLSYDGIRETVESSLSYFSSAASESSAYNGCIGGGHHTISFLDKKCYYFPRKAAKIAQLVERRTRNA